MKILITDGGDIINQDHIKKIEIGVIDEFVEIIYFIANTHEGRKSELFHIDEGINSTFAEELFKEILINECKKDVIDMKEVKNIYKNGERLELDKEIKHEEI